MTYNYISTRETRKNDSEGFKKHHETHIPYRADTTITYQGRLDSEGQPHTGTVGMVFELYDQASGGSQQGPALNESIQVTDGLFQAELDFGEQPYEEGYWLQITVNGQLLVYCISGLPFTPVNAVVSNSSVNNAGAKDVRVYWFQGGSICDTGTQIRIDVYSPGTTTLSNGNFNIVIF